MRFGTLFAATAVYLSTEAFALGARLEPGALYLTRADGKAATVLVSMRDTSDLAELLSILDEETEIATKTKMNADYVPGIVTVLQGDDMEAKGVRTVWEALGFVPGVEITINNLGQPLVLVRGIGNTITGHLKMLVDSVPVNATTSGSNDPTMLLPIEQVERIEMIRGPGAAVYGEFSYAGVVNIITRKEEARAYVRSGRYGSFGGGVLFSYEDPEADLQWTLNASAWASDTQVNSGPDILATRGGPQARLSFSPGPTNEDEHVQSLISTLEYKKFHLEMIGVKRDHGVYFGVSSLAPSGNGKPVENENYFINARQAVDFSADLKADFSLNFSAWKDIVRTLWVLPSGATVASPTGRRIFFPNGLILGGGTRERRIEGASDFTWTGWKNHQWLLSLSLADVRLVDSWGTSNFNAVTAKVLPTVQLLPEDQDNVVDPGQSRRIISAALQDQFALSEFFTVTTGIRYDNFDDVGNSLTPRVAGVWRAGERHILKFQYSQAFRPPNFIELYTPATSPGRQGNPDLNPETMETYETGYIYRGMGQVGRATVYYSKLHDMITSPAVSAHSDRKPRNVGSVRSQGVELEWEQALTEDWKVLANLTYADAYDETNRHAVGGSANWLGNLMLKGRVLENLLVTARYSSIGKRDRIPGDDREQLPGYHTLDVTLNVFDFGKKGLTLRTGVKNLFGTDIKVPSRANTYVNDLPRPGSIWWAQISQSF